MNKWVRWLSVLRRAFLLPFAFSKLETVEAGGNNMNTFDNLENFEKYLIKLFYEAGILVTELQNPLYADGVADFYNPHIIILDEPKIDMIVFGQEDY